MTKLITETKVYL